MKKKMLICGATGFIGRNLAEAFMQDSQYEVYGTYLNSKPWRDSRIRMIQADLREVKQVEKVVKGMDIIIQAAATTSGAQDMVNRPYLHVTDNAVMNSLLLRASYDHHVSRFVFFSCTVMYGSRRSPVREIDFDANAPFYPHYHGVGWTKVYIEKMCEFYARLGRTSLNVIRHSNIYGPHDKFDLEKSHVFGATLTKVLDPTSREIVVWGDGRVARDLLYVSDLVNYVKLALTQQEHSYLLHNVGLGQAITIDELVKKIIFASGAEKKIRYDHSKPNIDTRLCVDYSQAQTIGWEPKISLEEGIRKTIEWHRDFIMPSILCEAKNPTVQL